MTENVVLCEACLSENVVTSLQFDSHWECLDCGLLIQKLDNFSKSVSYGNQEALEFSSFSYRRSAHFADWLANSTARESMVVPEEVLELVMSKLHERKVREENITVTLIRSVLKQLQLKKYYEHATLVTTLITNKRAKTFTNAEETQLKIMFALVQEPFEKCKPKDRTNFLSYSYVLYKCCQLLGIRRMLGQFKLLKGAEKRHAMDKIWRDICAELHWAYIPSC